MPNNREFLAVKSFLTLQIADIRAELKADEESEVKITNEKRISLDKLLMELLKSRSALIMAYKEKKLTTLEEQAKKSLSEVNSILSKGIIKSDIALISLDDLKIKRTDSKKKRSKNRSYGNGGSSNGNGPQLNVF
jgi:hypothetical protein